MEPSSTVLDKPRKCLDFSIKFRVLALINSGGLFSMVTVEDISSPFPPCIFFVHSTNQASPIAMLAMPQETNFTVWEPIRSVRSIFPQAQKFFSNTFKDPLAISSRKPYPRIHRDHWCWETVYLAQPHQGIHRVEPSQLSPETLRG